MILILFFSKINNILFKFLKKKSYFIQLFLNKLYYIQLLKKNQTSKFIHQIKIKF
jgi:hypothetical protein